MTTPSDQSLEAKPHRLIAFLIIGLELLLIVVFVHQFEIEDQKHFLPVLVLAAIGYTIHAWLPASLRLGFFVLLSWIGIMLYLGWIEGGLVLGLGCALITICYLPGPLLFRVGCLLTASLILVMYRVEWPASFWPVLGSMFMFRLILFVFDIHREHRRPPLLQSLAYFFLLPNVCFTLFPVIDFKVFRESHRQTDVSNHQTGIEWMVRGLTHLLLYRIIKYYVLPLPHELRDWPHLLLFLAANYALYLRVSGQFHVITGMLHLFDFALPRTHHNYFFASSFSDIWRRINIYWKDFMTKVFFMPVFFALRRWGTAPAMISATVCVFLATWLLHSYQVFWVLGDLPFSKHDAFLWLVVGTLVASNLLWDWHRDRLPRPAPATFSIPRAALRTLQIVGMFFLISLFWASWTFPEVGQALIKPSLSQPIGGRNTLLPLAGFVAMLAFGVLVQWIEHFVKNQDFWPIPWTFSTSAVVQLTVLSSILGALVIGSVVPADASFGRTVLTLRRESSTLAESRQLAQSYYEEIEGVHVQASPLLGALGFKDVPVSRGQTGYITMTRPVDDLLGRELIPGWQGEFYGKKTTVNQLGLRDREGLTLEKPAQTCRIACVGSSVVMGYGVGDDEVFCRLLEEKLNAAPRPGQPKYQLINFGLGMCYSVHRRVLIDRRVFAFQPEAIYYFAHQDELVGTARHLTKMVAEGRIQFPYPCLRSVLRKAEISRNMSPGSIEARLLAHSRELVLGIYQDLVAECRKRGVLAVWIYAPMPGIVDVSEDAAEMVRLAEEAGFVVVDLSTWADGHSPSEVKLDARDHHANGLGHQLIAQFLYAAIMKRPELLPACAAKTKPSESVKD